MERELTLEFVRVTEAAALASATWMGKGKRMSADQAAVDAMRAIFDTIHIDGVVVIGEGEMDRAPMLYIGERIGEGKGSPLIDIAVDPLDGTNLVACGLPNALSVVAAAESGCLLKAPDIYMDKIAVGPNAKGSIDIDLSVEENLYNIADALGMKVSDLTVVVLDRPRHKELIDDIRKVGARIRLITDGDVGAAIATAMTGTGVDVLMGIGGAPEGVLAAAALKCLGGEMIGKLKPQNIDEQNRAREMGITDINRILSMDDFIKSEDVMFAATGVTDGYLLQGVHFSGGMATTESIVMRSLTGTIRKIFTIHKKSKKPKYYQRDVFKQI